MKIRLPTFDVSDEELRALGHYAGDGRKRLRREARTYLAELVREEIGDALRDYRALKAPPLPFEESKGVDVAAE